MITDDDASYDGCADSSESVSIDGGAPVSSLSQPYSIELSFKDVQGVEHVETFQFFYADAWYFAPAPDSAFSEGATLGSYQSHTVGWDYEDVVCFADGPLIETDKGEIAVEELQPGNLCITDAGEAVPLRLNLARPLGPLERRAEKLAPVRVDAGALGLGCPATPLRISRQHRMLVRSAICQRMFGAGAVLIPAIGLTDLPGVCVDTAHVVRSYHHLVFDGHVILPANGTPSETFLPGPAGLAALTPGARAEFEHLFGPLDRQHWPTARPIPPKARQRRLLARHQANGKALVEA